MYQEGGFYAAEDADSLPTAEAEHKKEGAFCVWKRSEVEELLRHVPAVHGHPAAEVFCDFFDIKANGNVPHMYVSTVTITVSYPTISGPTSRAHWSEHLTLQAL